MDILIASSQYYPKWTSAAVQVRDLAQELSRRGHSVLVIVPSETISLNPPELKNINGINVLYLSSLKITNVGYIRRTLGEFLMPYTMYLDFKRTPYLNKPWDAVLWYSPSIFMGPLISTIKSRAKNKCIAYLILRDIFPEWAFHTGILREGFIYRFFRAVAAYQYSQADVIGIQSSSNATFLSPYLLDQRIKIEVLENWLNTEFVDECEIDISKTSLSGRSILAYIGNMGVAQNLDFLLDLAAVLVDRVDIGFIFAGRGSEVQRIKKSADEKNLKNVLFYDEIPSEQMSKLLSQCKLGLVSLNSKHQTHNIPGKFLTYMREGLPVLAHINPNSDLERLIVGSNVGYVYTGNSVEELRRAVENILDNSNVYADMSKNALNLYLEKFTPIIAANQIIQSIKFSKIVRGA